MLIAVATQPGSSPVEVHFAGLAGYLPAQAGDAESEVEPKDGPSPIAPEPKELFWGAGSFIVFAVLMRLVLYPRLKKGMEARYANIRTGHESADATRQAAQAEMSEYQAQLAVVRAEATARIDAARQTLEAERQERLAEVNARIAERRAEALARVEAEREAARAQIEEAVGELVSDIVSLAIGKQPDRAVVSRAVTSAMTVGAAQ